MKIFTLNKETKLNQRNLILDSLFQNMAERKT